MNESTDGTPSTSSPKSGGGRDWRGVPAWNPEERAFVIQIWDVGDPGAELCFWRALYVTGAPSSGIALLRAAGDDCSTLPAAGVSWRAVPRAVSLESWLIRCGITESPEQYLAQPVSSRILTQQEFVTLSAAESRLRQGRTEENRMQLRRYRRLIARFGPHWDMVVGTDPTTWWETT